MMTERQQQQRGRDDGSPGGVTSLMSARQGFRADPPFHGRGDSRVEQLRLPPQSVEAEQAVLGGLMLDNATWDQIADRVSEPDFYRNEHR